MFQVLFPLFKEHHKEIEEQAEKAKQSIKDKLGDFFKNEKKENNKNETLDKMGNFFKAKDKPEKPEKEEKSLKKICWDQEDATSLRQRSPRRSQQLK